MDRFAARGKVFPLNCGVLLSDSSRMDREPPAPLECPENTRPAASSNKRAQWRDLFGVALIAPRYFAGAYSEGLVRRAGARLRKKEELAIEPDATLPDLRKN